MVVKLFLDSMMFHARSTEKTIAFEGWRRERGKTWGHCPAGDAIILYIILWDTTNGMGAALRANWPRRFKQGFVALSTNTSWSLFWIDQVAGGPSADADAGTEGKLSFMEQETESSSPFPFIATHFVQRAVVQLARRIKLLPCD